MELTILFAPLVGAILCGFGWRAFGETAAMCIATGLLFLSALLSWVVFLSFDGTTRSCAGSKAARSAPIGRSVWTV